MFGKKFKKFVNIFGKPQKETGKKEKSVKKGLVGKKFQIFCK
jgi:hypothetical protein